MFEQLAQIIKESGSIVFFGGAGVSTESGIPDFRSEEGLFRARDNYGLSPETLLSHSFFKSSPEKFFEYYIENLIYADAKPNAAHAALAELERQGKLRAAITQNIDGLHQMAGSKTVYELHGSVVRNYCMHCGRRYELAYMLSPLKSRNRVPICKICGGIVRPDVVLYEEPLDNGVMQEAVRAIRSADTLIVGGTSLAVYPAAGLINYFSGKHLVLINRSPTPYDDRAELVLHDSIGKVLTEAVYNR